MDWHIVADSSCDLLSLAECPANADFSTVPFSIRIGDREYIDDEHMPVADMLTANEVHGVSAQTACPAPNDWVERFLAPGPVLAFTISSALSGSYNSACTAREMVREDMPDKPITVIDTRATGPASSIKRAEMARASRANRLITLLANRLASRMPFFSRAPS